MLVGQGIDYHPIDLLPAAGFTVTTHFEVTDTLDGMFGWLDREPMVAGRGPLLGCAGGPIVHSFILRGV